MKTEHTQDRRAVRTRRALREALVSLILEKGYDAITVQDITDRADLNRGTLYLHYRDKQDLLIRSSEEIFSELIAQFEPLRLNNLDMAIPDRHLIIVFRHAAANADFYRVMLGVHGVPQFVTRLRQLIAQVGIERLNILRALSSSDAVPSELVAGFVSGSILGVLEWWLQTHLTLTPEALAHHVLQLIVTGVYPSIGIDPPAFDAPPQ